MSESYFISRVIRELVDVVRLESEQGISMFEVVRKEVLPIATYQVSTLENVTSLSRMLIRKVMSSSRIAHYWMNSGDAKDRLCQTSTARAFDVGRMTRQCIHDKHSVDRLMTSAMPN